MSARGESRWRTAHLMAAGLGAAAVIALRWLPQLGSSLWLDETGTVWLLRGSFTDALARALEYQGGSPLFYVIEWVVEALFGSSELALRAPSIVAMGLATAFVFFLGRRLFDTGAGAIAALVFVSLPIVGFAAGDARPYALATMTLVASALALVRWLESGRTSDACLYVVAFAATVYLHYLFALALAAQGVYVLVRRRDAAVTTRRLLAVYAAIAAALLPAVPTLLRVLSERSVLSNPFPVTPAEVVGALLPGSIALLLVIGGIVAAVVWRPRRLDLNDGAVVFLLAWFGITFVALVAVSTISSATVLVPRYFMSVLPAIALLVGALLSRIGATWPQVGLVVAVAVLAIVRFPLPEHTHEDWRAVAALERALVDDPTTPVLLFAGFIEARQLDWLEDPEKSSYLNAPAAAYDFDGDVVALPFGVNDESTPLMNEIVRERLDGVDEFVLVTRGIDSTRRWLDERLGADGMESVERANFDGEILVYLFSRS